MNVFVKSALVFAAAVGVVVTASVVKDRFFDTDTTEAQPEPTDVAAEPVAAEPVETETKLNPTE